jgi:hypothetical protein
MLDGKRLKRGLRRRESRTELQHQADRGTTHLRQHIVNIGGADIEHLPRCHRPA